MIALIKYLYLIALPFVVLGIIGYSYYSFRRVPRAFALGTIASLLAAGCLTLDLLAMLYQHGAQFVLVGGARYLLAAWTIMLVYFVAEFYYRIRLLGPLLMPVALLLMVVANFMPEQPVTAVPVHGLEAFLIIHTVLVFASFGLIFLAFAGAVMYLLKARALKIHGAGAISGDLPAVDTSRRVMVTAFHVGLPLLTIGLVLGVAYAAATLHGEWLWYGKTVLGLVIWMMYSALFFLYHSQHLTVHGLARGVVLLLVVVAVSFLSSSHREIVRLFREPPAAAQESGTP